jgi:hypothetical protein
MTYPAMADSQSPVPSMFAILTTAVARISIAAAARLAYASGVVIIQAYLRGDLEAMLRLSVMTMWGCCPCDRDLGWDAVASSECGRAQQASGSMAE